jgi:hypothetical protein
MNLPVLSHFSSSTSSHSTVFPSRLSASTSVTRVVILSFFYHARDKHATPRAAKRKVHYARQSNKFRSALATQLNTHTSSRVTSVPRPSLEAFNDATCAPHWAALLVFWSLSLGANGVCVKC